MLAAQSTTVAFDQRERGVINLSSTGRSLLCIPSPPVRVLGCPMLRNVCCDAVSTPTSTPPLSPTVWNLNCNGTKNKADDFGRLFSGAWDILCLQESSCDELLPAILPSRSSFRVGTAQNPNRHLVVAWDASVSPSLDVVVLADTLYFLVVVIPLPSEDRLVVANVHLSASSLSIDIDL